MIDPSDNSSPAQTALPAQTASPSRRLLKTFAKWFIRATVTCIALAILFIVSAWGLARIPCNTDFMHAEDGVEIAVVHNGVHVDLVLPLTSKSFDWLKTIRPKHFVMDQDNLSFALFGWGNRQFYLETPQWKDLKVTTVLIAMAGQGRTVMHVDKRSQLPKASDKCRRIRITTDQYQRLCSHIHSSFEVEASGEFRPIPGAHYRDVDAFYEAAGSYHLFNTCNVWAGNALRLAGVRIGWWTPTTSGVFACLPDNAPDESNK